MPRPDSELLSSRRVTYAELINFSPALRGAGEEAPEHLFSSFSEWIENVEGAADQVWKEVRKDFNSHGSDEEVPQDRVTTLLAVLRNLLSGYNLFGLAVGSLTDDQQLNAFARYAAIGSLHHALFLIGGHMKRAFWWRFVACCWMLTISLSTSAQDQAKKKVLSQTDLPRFSYPMQGSVVDFLNSDFAAFNAFAAQVRANLDSVFHNYDIQDKTTLRHLLRVRVNLQILAGESEAALKTLQAACDLEEKPRNRAICGMLYEPELLANIETKSASGPTFEAAFARNFAKFVNQLPWTLVQENVKLNIAGTAIYDRSTVRARIERQLLHDLQPMIDKSKALNEAGAEELIDQRAGIELFPDQEQTQTILKILGEYISAQNAKMPDIFQPRDVTLTNDQKLTPVLVGIWDGGVDTTVFPDQLYTDPNPGWHDSHGLAFDDQGSPSKDLLYPLTEKEQQRYPAFLSAQRGISDLTEGVDSADAAALRRNSGMEFSPEDSAVDHYLHGTHVTGIALRGNPAARLVVLRFVDVNVDLFRFPPTMEWVTRVLGDIQQIADYCHEKNVRVVNMSWGDDVPEFETWLMKTGSKVTPEEREKQATELFAVWKDGIAKAIQSAPQTLFVAAGGNSNSSTGFQEFVPASLRLPNLMAVGAVDRAGEETTFTSYGDTVVVDADGEDVESFVPGGTRLKVSGTSMAAPAVTNLAAKLFALDPTLTPEQAIALIREGATTSPDGRRHLINPRESVALLETNKNK